MTDGLESLGRVRATGLALLVVAFLAGGAAGAAGGDAWTARHRPGDGGPMGRGGMPGMMGPRMGRDGLPPGFDRLDLSAEQKQRVTEILERTRPRTDSILRQAMPRLRAITDSTRAEIHAVLTPAQRDQLERERPRFARPEMGPPN